MKTIIIVFLVFFSCTSINFEEEIVVSKEATADKKCLYATNKTFFKFCAECNRYEINDSLNKYFKGK
jgi:hypothetical protein